MCAIAGIVGDNLHISDDILNNMKKTMHRRGPDENGIYKNNSLYLIHTRLSVVDLVAGKQPMLFEDFNKKYVIVYNGEIYNTEEVRNKLIKLGHKFKEKSDTEVILHSYIEWGENCVNYLNGIFAFAIAQPESKKIFLARDRMGVKPLFYTIKNDTLIFASEIKTILEHPQIEAVIDESSLTEIFLLGPGKVSGSGVFKGIKELKRAHYATFYNGNFKTEEYWKLEEKKHEHNFHETCEKIKDLITRSVKNQLNSDVPVGMFLSGGLDSSIITAISSSNIKNLKTFSVDYVDNEKYFKSNVFQPDSDKLYIEEMVQNFNLNHSNIVLNTEDLVTGIFTALKARDLPGMADVDASLLLFSEKVKKEVTVALSGECADEIFGGYPWYRDEKIRNEASFPWAKNTLYRTTFINENFSNIKNYAEEYVKDLYEKELEGIVETSPLERRMKEMMKLNINWFMQTLLDRSDRMTMYNGLEVRVPFCDHNIVEYLYNIPWEMKDYKSREKGLLREAMKGLLPENVLWRKKSPYPKTHNPSYLNSVTILLEDLIKNKNNPIFQIVETSSLKNLLSAENSIPWYGQLMTKPQTIAYFLQINYWLKTYKVKIE